MTEENDVEMVDAEQETSRSNPNIIDIPLGTGEEELTINLDTDLPDFEEMCTLLERERAETRYWLAVGTAYARKGEIDSAVRLVSKGLSLEDIARSDPDKLAFYSCLCWLYLRQKREAPNTSGDGLEPKEVYFRHATEMSNKAMQIDRSTTSNALARGALNISVGKFDDAMGNFDQILRESANANLFANMGKARVLYQKKNYKDALKLYQLVLLGRPSIIPDPRIGIGLCFWHLGDKDGALQAWRRSDQLYQSEASNVLIALWHIEKALQDIADDDFALNYATGIEYAQRAFRANRYDSAAATILASYLFSRKNMDAVKSLSERSITGGELKSLRAEGWFWKGRAHHYLEEYDEAIRCYDQSKEEGGGILPQIAKGLVLMAQESSEALPTFEDVVERNPNSLEGLLILGLLLAQRSADARKYRERAVVVLEKYVRLAKSDDQLPHLDALLTLAKLTEEQNKFDRTLQILQEIIETHSIAGIGARVYNNMGAINYIKNNLEAAKVNFETAAKELETHPDDHIAVTLKFNQARLEDAHGNLDAARAGYREILEKHPDYLEARVRLVYLDLITGSENATEDLNNLMDLDGALPLVRALNGWHLRKQKGSNDEEMQHIKSTLVDYDKYDTYSLVSFGNQYLKIARESRSSDTKRKQKYFGKAAEHFHKVLQIDKNNAYAAQGVAIIFAETKRCDLALQIFSKIRETLNDVAIYINMGHCYGELKQYVKAIESYELALNRFNNQNDPQLLTLLGKAWHRRGMNQQSFEALRTSLDYSKKARALLENPVTEFNVAFVQLNIAQLVLKTDKSRRTVEQIEEAIKLLESETIPIFEKLGGAKQAPFADLTGHAESLKSGILEKLQAALVAQREYQSQNKQKLEEALQKQKEERERLEREKAKREEEEKEREVRLAEERERLQQQAQEWAQRAQEDAEREKEKELEERMEKLEKKERKKAEPKERKERKKKASRKRGSDSEATPSTKGRRVTAATKKKFKSKDFISDSDDVSSDEGNFTNDRSDSEASVKATDDEAEASNSVPEEPEGSTKKKRRVIEDDDEE